MEATVKDELKCTVVNIKHENADVFIGRPSVFGNPFEFKDDTLAEFRVSNRTEAIARFKEWFIQQPELMAKLPELKGKKLGCFCKPKSCHGDFIAGLVNAL